jgi:cell wall-associated NlpC family hydrolase
MNLPAGPRPVSRASKHSLAPLRVAMGTLFGSSGEAKSGGGVTRPIIVVVWGFVFASVLVSLAALSANAQTATSGEQYASDEPPQAKGTAPDGGSAVSGSEAAAEPAVSSANGLGPSQGSFTEGRAGPDEPSLVDDTPPTAAERGEPLATSRSRASGGNAVVRAARRHLGTRYRYATCSSSRMSCTCLTKKAWARFGHKLSMSERGQWRYDRARYVPKSRLRPGDIVFFKEGGRRSGITHVGLYSGRGNLVHASAYFGKVVESKMRYIKGYSGAKRLRPR